MSPFGRGCGSKPGQNMETLTMSRKERDRLTIMTRVKQRVLTLVVAAGLMGLGYRQAKRGWRRDQGAGGAGLGHRVRGGPRLGRAGPEGGARGPAPRRQTDSD